MRLIRALIFFIYVFIPGFFAGAAPNYVIVSDIDDTIQKTRVHWKDNPLATAKNFLTFHDAFIGMPALYNALAAQGLEVHYVTAVPRVLSVLPDRFLQTSGFPIGPLWGRDSFFEPTLEFKVRKITELMQAYPDAQFILIGDNGQHDVEAYRQIQKHPELGHRVAEVFIHQVYDFTKGTPLGEGQKPYISTAEITLDLRASGFLNDQTTKNLLEQVDRGMTSRYRNIENLTIAEFATYDQKSIEALIERARLEPNSEIRSLIASIAHSMNDALPRTKQVAGDAFTLSRAAPLCSRIF